MGYANPAQLSSGIHTRQYARAFVIGDDKERVVFVSVDSAMIDQIVKTEVRKRILPPLMKRNGRLSLVCVASLLFLLDFCKQLLSFTFILSPEGKEITHFLLLPVGLM